MTARIEKTVFISYRRTNFPWAYCIYQDLTHHGYDVFFDYQSIDSGSFEKVILENIKARAHFIIILSPSALERCDQPGDWLRREIETAIDEKRNVIPVMLEGFDFGSPLVKKALTGKLSSLSGFNGMSLIAEYVEAGFEKLRNRFLNVTLEDIHLHTLPEDTRKITVTQQAAANKALPVEMKELSAQEWFERGYVFQKQKIFDEAIRCYTEVIKRGLDNTNLAVTYNNRSNAHRYNGNLQETLNDLNEAVHLNPAAADHYINRSSVRLMTNDPQGALVDINTAIDLAPDSAEAYYNRGLIYRAKNDLQNALADFEKAITLRANHGGAYLSLMNVLLKMGRKQEAKMKKQTTQKLIEKDDLYNLACFESTWNNKDKAIELLKIALEKGQESKAWAQQDPDFENIREDPRFKELVGE